MTPLPHFPHNILCIPMVSDLVFILFFLFFPQMTTETLGIFLPMPLFVMNCGKLLKRR